MGNKRLTVSRKTLQLFLMLFVFFPPMSLSQLIKTSSFWQGVNYIFKLGQLAFASYGIFHWMKSWKRERSGWFILLMLHMIGMLVACLPNGSMDLDVLQRMYCEIGFCFLSAELFRMDRRKFIEAGLGVFAVYTLWGVLTIFLFPKGFNHARTTYSALYGLGAKNNSFPFYFAFFFFMILNSFEKNRQIPKKMPVVLLITMAAGIICESMNTLLCLMLLLILYLLMVRFRFAFSKISPRTFFIAFAVIISLIYVGTQLNLVRALLMAVNRSTNFSGRTALWERAFTNMTDHPLFGAGYYSTFTLLGGTVSNHAHSQWLDKMAKFGIVQAIPLFIMLYLTFVKAGKYHDKRVGNACALLLLIYMLHMSFDTYNYNFFTVLVVVINGMLVDEAPGARKKHSLRKTVFLK